MPMFPLGSVLLPGMPLALRVFEERYLKMMGALLDDDTPQFGVVLIERGHEVGGGEKRFELGTLAEILQIEAPDGPLSVLARGTRRFRVEKWLTDDPYPQAEIELLGQLETDQDDSSAIHRAEHSVRSALRYLHTLTDDLPWSADLELSEDPEERLWQLAGISPLGPLDHLDFLRSTTVTGLADQVHQTVEDALVTFRQLNASKEEPEAD